MQIINFYKKKNNNNNNRRAIWKPSGKWSCFVVNILVWVKDVSTYQKKKNCIYLFSLVFFFIYI